MLIKRTHLHCSSDNHLPFTHPLHFENKIIPCINTKPPPTSASPQNHHSPLLSHPSPLHSSPNVPPLSSLVAQVKSSRIKTLRNITELNITYYQIVVSRVLRYLSYSYDENLYSFMNNFNSQLYLLLVMLPFAMAGITNFWDMTRIDREVLVCLKQEGYLEEAFVLANFDGESQKWEVAVEIEELEKLKVWTNLVVATTQIQGRLPPQLEAHRLARQFHTASIDKFWISISNFVAGFQPSCNYFKTFALFLHLYTKKEIGFQSQRMFWEDLFGKAEACGELGRYDLYLSFNNFQQFGGWRDYEYYETYRPVPVCNYPGMEVFKN